MAQEVSAVSCKMNEIVNAMFHTDAKFSPDKIITLQVTLRCNRLINESTWNPINVQASNHEIQVRENCVICMSRKADVVLLPCAHSICAGCCSSGWFSQGKCQTCKQNITGIFRLLTVHPRWHRLINYSMVDINNAFRGCEDSKAQNRALTRRLERLESENHLQFLNIRDKDNTIAELREYMNDPSIKNCEYWKGLYESLVAQNEELNNHHTKLLAYVDSFNQERHSLLQSLHESKKTVTKLSKIEQSYYDMTDELHNTRQQNDVVRKEFNTAKHLNSSLAEELRDANRQNTIMAKELDDLKTSFKTTITNRNTMMQSFLSMIRDLRSMHRIHIQQIEHRMFTLALSMHDVKKKVKKTIKTIRLQELQAVSKSGKRHRDNGDESRKQQRLN